MRSLPVAPREIPPHDPASRSPAHHLSSPPQLTTPAHHPSSSPQLITPAHHPHISPPPSLRYLVNYTHWGYSDLDIVLGQLPRFIERSELRDFHMVTYSFGDNEVRAAGEGNGAGGVIVDALGESGMRVRVGCG